jgi:uncharacterized protein YbjT (DUF2867 family)
VRSRERAEHKGAFDAPPLSEIVDDWVVGDPRDVAKIPGLLDGVDHVASALGVTRQKADPWDIDFRANLALLELAEAHHTKSFLYVNVMNVHDGTSTLMRAKAAFSEALRRSAVTPHIVNPSGYFSDLTQILEMARKGVAVRLGEGSVRLSPIHGADLAAFCAERIMGHGGEFNVGGPDVLTYRQITELAFDAAGKKPHWLALPTGVRRPAVWIADRISPRASSLTRFFLEGLEHDSAGEPTGSRHLADYFHQVVHETSR